MTHSANMKIPTDKYDRIRWQKKKNILVIFSRNRGVQSRGCRIGGSLDTFFDVPISNKEGGNWVRAVLSVLMMQTNMRNHLFNRIHSLRSLAILT